MEAQHKASYTAVVNLLICVTGVHIWRAEEVFDTNNKEARYKHHYHRAVTLFEQAMRGCRVNGKLMFEAMKHQQTKLLNIFSRRYLDFFCARIA